MMAQGQVEAELGIRKTPIIESAIDADTGQARGPARIVEAVPPFDGSSPIIDVSILARGVAVPTALLDDVVPSFAAKPELAHQESDGDPPIAAVGLGEIADAVGCAGLQVQIETRALWVVLVSDDGSDAFDFDGAPGTDGSWEPNLEATPSLGGLADGCVAYRTATGVTCTVASGAD